MRYFTIGEMSKRAAWLRIAKYSSSESHNEFGALQPAQSYQSCVFALLQAVGRILDDRRQNAGAVRCERRVAEAGQRDFHHRFGGEFAVFRRIEGALDMSADGAMTSRPR
jgi:hypothetical protein